MRIEPGSSMSQSGALPLRFELVCALVANGGLLYFVTWFYDEEQIYTIHVFLFNPELKFVIGITPS